MNTTVNGKTVRLFKNDDISREFSDLVQAHLQEGYIFNLSESSRGSQTGVLLSVDLTNDFGKTVIRVCIEWLNCGLFCRGLTICIRKFSDCNGKLVLWNSDGEIVCSHSFYSILSARHSDKDIFVDDIEVAEALEGIRRNRYLNRCDNSTENVCSDNYKLPVLRLVKKVAGFKSTRLCNIEKVVRNKGEYRVYLTNGKMAKVRVR